MTGLSSVAPFAGTVADAIENIVASIPATREAASNAAGKRGARARAQVRDAGGGAVGRARASARDCSAC